MQKTSVSLSKTVLIVSGGGFHLGQGIEGQPTVKGSCPGGCAAAVSGNAEGALFRALSKCNNSSTVLAGNRGCLICTPVLALLQHRGLWTTFAALIAILAWEMQQP